MTGAKGSRTPSIPRRISSEEVFVPKRVFLGIGPPSILLGALAATAAGQTPSKEAAALRERVNRPVVYTVPGTDRVRVRKNLVYKKDGAVPLEMDVYTPHGEGAPGRRPPVVVFIHGGVPPDVPVRPKDWGIYESWGRLVAASGMAGIAFNHRVGFPDPNLVTAESDLRDAIEFVRSRAAELGVDGDRIALAAFSAGGPLLAPAIREPRPYVRCLVAFYAFLDLTQSALHRRFLSEEVIRRFSPAAAVAESSAALPPMFVARAGRDQIPDLLPGLDRFVSEALKKNVDLAFFNQPGGEHGFDNVPGDSRSREIVREAVEFLRRNLDAR
jgi:acetyl esterase/lipase